MVVVAVVVVETLLMKFQTKRLTLAWLLNLTLIFLQIRLQTFRRLSKYLELTQQTQITTTPFRTFTLGNQSKRQTIHTGNRLVTGLLLRLLMLLVGSEIGCQINKQVAQ